MLDSSGILNKDFIKLANQAEKFFKKQKDIASIAIDDLPESESKMKEKFKAILKSSTSKNANHEELMKAINKIVRNGRND